MPTPKKHSSVRARANKASTAAVLEEVPEDEVVVPSLPTRFDEDGHPDEWRPETLDWWADLWAAPMSGEYHSSDRHGLFRLAALVDNYWRSPSAKTHAEVRLAQKDYGLTPYDRRRLEWTIEGAEKAKADGAARRGRTGAPAPQVPPDENPPDPRLRLVSN